MTSSTKIPVYSLSDLKNTTDDALPVYLTTLPNGPFKQSHRLADVRLALGYTAVAIAGVLFYFDWTLGWDKTKAYTGPAVLAYFLLNGMFTYWIWAVEKGTVFAGSRGKNQITIASKTKDHIPIYHLTVTVDGRQLEIKAPFTRWFSADGYFVAKPFQQWLASEISVIGEADPNNVVEEIGRGNVVDGVRPEKVQDVLDQIRKGAATGSSPGSGKARRRG
ncbi:hypothetical protein H2199_001185 [Coniosporium tulheliwenetii]|uniref:Uncharacterized protein n=1 Tax=Coniosporium tulheliwenetii TaxID=3383036 RepID=A0ACC2ZLT3_9PEZI|nr:hypothetical protein H2199_001185 [Cladosporium sp. JES 115]